MSSHSIPAYIMALDDIGDIDAPKGSVSWARAMRVRLTQMARRTATTLDHFKGYLFMMEAERGYQQLEGPCGQPFPTLVAFCAAKPPYGLGYDQEVIDAIQAETRAMLLGEKVREVKTLRTHGGDRKSESVQGASGTLKRGTNSIAYLSSRLKRDRPDLLDAYARGEYKSVHAAAKAAGIVKEETPLRELLRAWGKASDAERVQFFHQIPDSGRALLLKALDQIEAPTT